MLRDCGLATEEHRAQISDSLKWRTAGSRGCTDRAICSQCNHLVIDSICLCSGSFVCPNCGYKNGADLVPMFINITDCIGTDCIGTKSLMPRPRRESEFPVSRDWEDIACKATGCRYNCYEKCLVPSRCKISATGQCEGFEPSPIVTKVDGD